jgi:transcriptional regulator with GAF, ATPase, and Fis domain
VKLTGPERELAWLRRLGEVARRFADERDVRALLPSILDAAIELTEAERGFLVSLERSESRGARGKPRLKIEAARGFLRESLQAGPSKVSRTVVARVLERKAPLVTSREEDQDVRDVSSIRRRRVLAIACVPLLLRDEVHGVLYLDHRFDPEAFQEQDVPILAAFADQAVLALAVAEAATAVPAEARANVPAVARGAVPLPPVLDVPRSGRLVGASPVMRELVAQLDRCARSRAPVLVTGESGSGKELVARELHARGLAPGAPFLSESCGAIAETLLESELFGHQKGAFTGADSDRLGLFLRAGTGTLFLDEVADTSPVMQAKLLRVLQEGVARPVGGDDVVAVRCRVIVACNQDLRELVRAGRFREDLYYRLDVLRLRVPPLRERKDDIPALVRDLIDREGEGRALELTPDAVGALVAHDWPGNVRELENEVRRLLALGLPRVGREHLSLDVRGEPAARAVSFQGKTIPQVEREMVAAALKRAAGNKSRAARELGVSRGALYQLIARHGLS